MGRSRAARQARQDKKQRQQLTTWAIIGVVAVVVIGLVVAIIVRSSSGGGTDSSAEWEEIPTQEGIHIEGMQPEAVPTYNSDPPTSGPHYGQPVLPKAAGVYEEGAADLNLVHSLEHGYVIIWYDCAQITNCDSVKDGLETVFNQTDQYKVIVMPREDMEAPVIAVSWGMMYKQYDFDVAKLINFVERNREQSPEPAAP